jgi:SAM-dependent methyltransferase
MDLPAWRLLDTQLGVQEHEYNDSTRPLVQQMFARPPRRLLDIGCSTGAVAGALKQADPVLWAWGCEPNTHTAEAARKRLDRVTTAPRPEWSDEDKSLLATIDTVLLLDVLEHMYNPWAELEFLSQTLAPGAQVIVSLPNIGHIGVLAGLSVGQFRYEREGILDVTHVRFFTVQGMHEMLVQTGFAIDGMWILNSSGGKPPEHFPARVAIGKMEMTIDSRNEWDLLHSIQFGFRLRPAKREGIAG